MIHGGPGDDRIWGGDAIDDVRPGPGADLVRLNRGSDYVFLRDDGAPDLILCGLGDDYVDRDEVDPQDEFVSCETVVRP